MTQEQKTVHRRLVCHTKPFFKELEELGFEEQFSDKKSPIRIFKLKNKFVYSHNNYMKFVTKDRLGQELIVHNGLTVHDEMLRFFATRDPHKVINNEIPEKEAKKEKAQTC